MKALGYGERGPVSAPNSVTEFDADMPVPGARDLLVEVRGVSVNPVDVKVRANRPPEGTRILGFDAAGAVKEVGSDVTKVQAGRRGVLCQRVHPPWKQCRVSGCR